MRITQHCIIMKLNKFALGILLVCATLLAFHGLADAAQEAIDRPAGEPIQNPSADSRESRFSPGGFLHLLLSPIKATSDAVRKFLGDRVENVNNGIDMVRLQTFKLFMQAYNKTYSADELPKRMALFFNRRALIEESVKSFRAGQSLFMMKENEFTDWDDEEIHKLAGVSLPSPAELDSEASQASLPENLDDEAVLVGASRDNLVDDNLIVQARIPAQKDWRTSGCVSKPINQYKCGACYAIATMSVVESMQCLTQESSPILSPQQIVDCASSRQGYNNFGCDGGWPTRVLKYLQDTNIAARETCYPFLARQRQCRIREVKAIDNCTVKAALRGNSVIQYKVLNNERDILYHVANTGPVITVMKATDKFLYYNSGIFDDASCSGRRDDVDHAIVIVGYGSENGVDYWIIKNSWGILTWGEGGYGRYRRGAYTCSIGRWGWVITG